MNNPKKHGELAEVRFLSRAIDLGYDISKPYGDSTPYDVVLGNGRRLFRVQLKSVSARSGSSFALTVAHGARVKRPYDPALVDFVAAYVFPLDAWYIIPVRALRSRVRIHLYPHQPHSRGRYERFRNAWHLFGQPLVPFIHAQSVDVETTKPLSVVEFR